jgi:hypothetical protein
MSLSHAVGSKPDWGRGEDEGDSGGFRIKIKKDQKIHRNQIKNQTSKHRKKGGGRRERKPLATFSKTTAKDFFYFRLDKLSIDGMR